MYQASNNCKQWMRNSEGDKLTAYPDPAYGWAVPTISVGVTGPGIVQGMTITQEESDQLFTESLRQRENDINGKLNVQSQDHFDSFLDFLYNCGPGNSSRDGFWTLAGGGTPSHIRFYRAGQFASCADMLPMWAHPPLPGLVVRCARRRNVFLGRDWRSIPDGNTEAAAAANRVAA